MESDICFKYIDAFSRIVTHYIHILFCISSSTFIFAVTLIFPLFLWKKQELLIFLKNHINCYLVTKERHFLWKITEERSLQVSFCHFTERDTWESEVRWLTRGLSARVDRELKYSLTPRLVNFILSTIFNEDQQCQTFWQPYPLYHSASQLRTTRHRILQLKTSVEPRSNDRTTLLAELFFFISRRIFNLLNKVESSFPKFCLNYLESTLNLTITSVLEDLHTNVD